MKKQTMGDRIGQLREAYMMTKAEFAKKIDVAPLSVGNIEKGTTQSFQPETLNKIVSVFGTTREWLEHGEGKMLPNGKVNINAVAPSWKDEAWQLAKEQIEKKDKTIDRLSVSFDRLTEFLSRMEINFLHPVKDVG